MTILENCDYYIRLIPLPGSVGGVLTPNDDGSYSMYLNDKHSGEMLLDDYMHEYEHILNCDFDAGKRIREIERERFKKGA